MDMRVEGNGMSEKKAYSTPRVIVHGTVAEITAGTWSCERFGKRIGYGDGYLLNIVPIASCS
jgi:hypothetical protein